MLRRQAVLAGSAWAVEHGIPASKLDAAVERYAASVKADVVAGRHGAVSKHLKMSREAMLAAVDADMREAVDGGVEEKVEFLLDYAIGSLEPARFAAALKDVVGR
jgi:hypothetical protein